MSDPVSLARALLAEDPDPETRAELEALLKRVEGGDEAARRDLADRFTGPLEFGTAGLRGRVEAGLSRMNRLAVIKATWGLGSHLLRGGRARTRRTRGVVVGFDGRHSSRRFAEDTAAVLAGLGIPVRLFPDPVPTPLLAFSVPQLAGGRRRDGDGQPQPAVGQRLQGLHGDRRPDHPAGRRCDRPPDRGCSALRRDRAARAGGRRGPGPAHARGRARRGRRGGLPRRPRARRRCTRAKPGRCASPTRRCTASATGSRSAPSPGPGSRAWPRSRRRPIPTAPSAPSPSRTPRSRERWTACWRWPPRRAPSWCWPTTQTPTGWPPRCPTRRAAATGCSRATRSACCSPTTRSSTPRRADGRSWWSRRWCPRACSRAWRATAAPATARRSPASSGSRTRRSAPSARASRSCSATRRRSATPSGRWCATRTASGRRCASPR